MSGRSIDFAMRRIADHALRIAAGLDRLDLLEEAIAHHGDADVARAQMLLRAVGDRALPDPGDDVLVDDVAGDPAAVLAPDRALPGRHAVLHVRLAALRHADEEPRHRQRVLVVDRHAPFEMAAEIEAVRPQRDAADGPVLVLFALALAHALVGEAVLELLELQLEVLRRVGVVAAHAVRPVVVHPFEVHGIDGVLLGLEPVARHVGQHDLAEAVLPVERLPHRQFGRRQRPHVGPQQAGALAHRIGLDLAAGLRRLRDWWCPRRADRCRRRSRRSASRDSCSGCRSPRPSRRTCRRGGAGNAGRRGRRCRSDPCRARGSRPSAGSA